MTSVANYAFKDCTGLTSVNFNATDYGTSTNAYIFDGCTSLATVSFGSSVKKIPTNLFKGIGTITGTVTIPASVTTIGSSVFQNCTGITRVNFNATNCTSTNSNVFNGCTSLETISIGYSVKNIPANLFKGCSGVTSVTIPASVTSIGNSAFQNCTGLATLNFNATNCATVGGTSYPSFEGCTALATVNIGSSVTNIPAFTFKGCSALESLTIPDSVTAIGDYAFDGTALTSLSLGAGLATVGESILNNVTALTTLTLAEGNENFYCANNGLYTVEEVDDTDEYTLVLGTGATTFPAGLNVKAIGDRAFSGIKGLTEISLPATLTSFGEFAFSSCSNLATVRWHGTIGQWCAIDFGNMTANPIYYAKHLYVGEDEDPVSDLVIPNGTEEIKPYAFYYLTVDSVTIPASVKSIGANAFSSFPSTSTANYLGTAAMWAEIDFASSSSNPAFYTKSLQLNGVTLTSADLTGATAINAYAFYNNTALTSVTIPDTVTTIGTYAFYGCTGLTNLSVPDSVGQIATYAFYGCTGLASITLPENDNYTTIEARVFYGCTNEGLTEIIIPANVTNIETYAFYDTHIDTVYYEGGDWSGVTVVSSGNGPITGATCYSYSEDLPNKFALTDDVLSYDGNYWHYVSSTPTEWVYDNENGVFKDFTYTVASSNLTITGFSGASISDLVIPDNAYGIAANAFKGNSDITSVTIGKGVVSIGSTAFQNCANLETVVINATAITSAPAYGSAAFKDCANLTSVTFGENVTIVPTGLFNGNNGFNTITIPENVTFIGADAFENCDGITTLNFNAINCSSSATGVGSSSFWSCNNISTVNFGDQVMVIPKYLLGNGINALRSVVIPASVTAIEVGAFQGCNSLIEVKNLSALELSAGETTYGYVAAYAKRVYTEGESYVVMVGDFLFFDNKAENREVSLMEYYGEETALVLPAYVVEGVSYNYSVYRYAFNGKSALTSVTVPASVTAFENNAFASCSGLTEVNYVTVGENAATAAKWAAITFENTTANPVYFARSLKIDGESLTEADLTEATKVIAYAFYYNTALTSVILSADTTELGTSAFAGATNIVNAYYCGDEEAWAAVTVGASNAPLTNKLAYMSETAPAKFALENEVLSYAGNYWHFVSATPTAWVYDNENGEFKPFTYTVDESGNLTITGFAAATLSDLVIPDNAYAIAANAFKGNMGIYTLTLGKNLTSVGNGAFQTCYHLVEVRNLSDLTVEAGKTANGYAAFYAKRVYTEGETSVAKQNGYVFYDDKAEEDRTVLLIAYEGAETALTLPAAYDDGDDQLGYAINAYAFHATAATSVAIPAAVTAIGNYAFDGAAALASVTVAANSAMTTIGDRVFENDKELLTVTFGDNAALETIGGYVFHNCEKLTAFAFPESVTTVGTETFWNCYALTEMTIPDTVTTLGTWTFENCTGLLKATLGSGITALPANTFKGCAALTTIILPKEVTAITSSAFNSCTALATVYYTGTPEQFAAIEISGGAVNATFTDSTKYYFSETEPETLNAAGDDYDNNYWRYVGGVPTAWKLRAVFVSSASLALGEKIDVKYTLRLVGKYVGIPVTFTVDGEDFVVTEYAETAKADYYVYTISLSPAYMGFEIKASAILDGETVVLKDGYSIRTYCNNMLGRDDDYFEAVGYSAAKTEALRTLLKDMLCYGAMSQKYLNIATDDLVNAGITASDYETVTATDNYLVNDAPVEGYAFKGVTVTFGAVNRIKVVFNAEDAANVVLSVKHGDNEAVDFTEFTADNGTYYITTEGLTATQLDDVFTFTLKVNGEAAQTLRYSVKSYVYKYQSQTNKDFELTNLAHLTRALYNYGRAARAFALAD